MAGSLPRRPAPPAVALLTLVAAALTGLDAAASTAIPTKSTVTSVDPSDDNCSHVSADFTRWTPAAGAPARFVADAFARAPDSDLWVGLGYTDAGFWTAEAHAPNDACDTCARLDLVVTSFGGKRRSFAVITSKDQEHAYGGPADGLKNLALSRLWHLATTDWPVASMKQDYGFRLAPRDADGLSDPYPGWMAETSVPARGLLRFAFRVDAHVMCWCEFGWHGWNLAAPRKP